MVTRNISAHGAGVAMLVTGAETYGVAAVQRQLAMAFGEMHTFALGPGGQYDWLAHALAGAKSSSEPSSTASASGSAPSRFHRVDGLSSWSADGGAVSVAASMPAMLRDARRTAQALIPQLRAQGIKVVHIHWLPQAVIGIFLRQAGFKVLWHLHNSSAPGASAGIRQRVNHQIAARGCDHLLAVSDYVAGSWRGAGPGITVIHNGAEPLEASTGSTSAGPDQSDQSADQQNRDGFRCLSAGRLEPDKGHHVAIGAVAAAVDAGMDVHLDIAGGPMTDSPFVKSLLAQAHRAGLVASIELPDESDRVRLLGHVEDLRSRHQGYDLGFQGRISPEPCSVWVAEALVDGLPLIASSTGGTPELVADGVTGILVAPDSIGEAAAALLSLLRDPQRLAQMSAVAISRQTELSLAHQLARTADLHQRLLAS